MNDYQYFSPFKPNQMNVSMLVKKYLNEEMYLSDEFREKQNVSKMFSKYLANENSYLFEIGTFDGILMFLNVVPEYKALMDLKFWNKNLWKLSFARELRQFIGDFIDRFSLKRLETQTPDEEMAKVLKIAGFVNEGKFKYGFKQDGNLKTLFQLRIIRGG